jgi:hypothetical protein
MPRHQARHAAGRLQVSAEMPRRGFAAPLAASRTHRVVGRSPPGRVGGGVRTQVQFRVEVQAVRLDPTVEEPASQVQPTAGRRAGLQVTLRLEVTEHGMHGADRRPAGDGNLTQGSVNEIGSRQQDEDDLHASGPEGPKSPRRR